MILGIITPPIIISRVTHLNQTAVAITATIIAATLILGVEETRAEVVTLEVAAVIVAEVVEAVEAVATDFRFFVHLAGSVNGH